MFCHTNPWIIIAEILRGNSNQALDYYLRINPSVREEISEIHRSEPYVYAQTIAGKNTINQGEAKNSWLTGTAAWNIEAILYWILGIQPTINGLRINPTVPETWSEFSVTRLFRNINYKMNFKRVGKGNSVKITVEGNELPSNVIPLQKNGSSVVHVNIEIGTLTKAQVIQNKVKTKSPEGN